jgi:hypothetical protein
VTERPAKDGRVRKLMDEGAGVDNRNVFESVPSPAELLMAIVYR